MGWVSDLIRQRMAEQAQRSARVTPVTPAPELPSVLGMITGQIQSDVWEYNDARGPQFMVSSTGNSRVQVIPKQPPLTTAVVEIDREGVISVTCPPAGPGIGRRGTFKEAQGRIVSLGNFVGEPQPPGEPMTPEGFSRFVLEPILFPAAN